MKIGVLGTGMVGQAIAGRLVEAGHTVMIGSRTSNNTRAAAWVESTGPKATQGTFADTARFGVLIFNCTSGVVSLDALKMAGETDLNGKILIDLANPLDSSGGLPVLAFCNTDSLAERIQKAFPTVRVVKTLNTMNVKVMINPQLLPGHHTVFMSGNDPDAKSVAARILGDLGWKQESIIDLGDITTARGTEMLLPIWLRLAGALGHTKFNFHIVVGESSKQ
jgi:predicted dinucleotide-binding enzyme